MSAGLIFISYSQDSDEHREKVLGLAGRLRLDGLDAQIDQYVQGTPEQGWPRWMLDQIDVADFVLVVCTETYYRRFRGHEVPERGKGADWEGALITQEIYDAKSRTVRFVPVMLAPGQEPFIPEPLRGQTHYELTSGERYQDLYAFLRGQAGVEAGPLGTLRPIAKRKASPLQFDPPPPEPPVAAPVMIGVPHRNPFFTGREELLAQLHQQLQKKGISALAQAAIHGLGGIGKTQTAIEYAHRRGKHYRFVLWVGAEGEAALGAGYLSIARELGLAEPRADLETAVQAVKTWLSREDGWLLVFDNADDPALVRAYLPPARKGGTVLLTSRAKSFVKVGIKAPFRVEILAPEDAVKFLIERTGKGGAEAAAELARELGYLPLALEQAAAYIETVGGGFAEYLARYRRQGVALFEKGEPSTDYRKTVATTWTLSFSAVTAASPASAELLTAAAFLVPDLVPIEVFTLGGSELGGLLAQKLEGAREDQLAFWELLEPLERYSLVERLPEAAFKLHRLTQEVIKDSLGKEGRWERTKRVVFALNEAYPSADFDAWPLCERLQPNARAMMELARSCSLEFAELGELFKSAGHFSWARGDHAGAKLFEEFSVEIFENLLGGEHNATLTSRNNLAITLRALGDLAGARKLHEQTLEIRERVLGDEHPDTLISRNSLAVVLHDLGDLAGARKLLEETLEVRERLFGAEDPGTLMSRNNLAEVLRSLGDLTGARMHQEQALEIRERVLGSEHPDALQSRSNLGLILHALGDFDGARALYEKNIEILERVLGVEHTETLASRNNLANTLFSLGDLTGARELHKQNLEIIERVLGIKHPSTTVSTWSLLRTVRQLDDADAEARLMEKLRWLIDCDENSIPSAHQREIRKRLLKDLNCS